MTTPEPLLEDTGFEPFSDSAIDAEHVVRVAACLDVPVATVRTRLFRAKARLRESIAREIDVAAQDVFGFAGARCDRIVARVLARIDAPSSADPAALS